MKIGPPFLGRCPSCRRLSKSPGFLSGNTIGATIWSDGQVIGPMWPFSSPIKICPYCREMICDDEIIDEKRGPWMSRLMPVRYLKSATYRKYREALEKIWGDNLEKEKLIRRHAWRAANDLILRRTPHTTGGPGISSLFGSILFSAVFSMIVFFRGRTLEKILASAAFLGYLGTAFMVRKIRNSWIMSRGMELVVLDMKDEKGYFYSNLKRLYDLLGNEGEELLEKAEIAREMGCFAEAESLLSRPVTPEFCDSRDLIMAQVRARNRGVFKLKEPRCYMGQ